MPAFTFTRDKRDKSINSPSFKVIYSLEKGKDVPGPGAYSPYQRKKRPKTAKKTYLLFYNI